MIAAGIPIERSLAFQLKTEPRAVSRGVTEQTEKIRKIVTWLSRNRSQSRSRNGGATAKSAFG